MTGVLEGLASTYGAWWIDFLGEHNHVGGGEATRWLMARARPAAGDRVLDAGAFVGAAARYVAGETGADVVALDANRDFLRAGARLTGGERVTWVEGVNQRLPFADGAFRSVWCLDSFVAPREFTRVAAPGAWLCLCTETPEDGRGGHEAFLDEWIELGWALVAHRPMTGEALQVWRKAEANLVGRRSLYEPRYGKRGYLAQLDVVAELVRSYTMHERGHALVVFRR